MLIVSSLLLQGQEFKKIEDSLIENVFRLNSTCDTSTLLLKEITSIPETYDYLNINNYCNTISPASNSITYSFTFYNSTNTSIFINSGYSVLSCSNINFYSMVLYDNTACRIVGEGYNFLVEEGHTYTWTLIAEATGVFCQGFSTICPYWLVNNALFIDLVIFQGEVYPDYINLEWETASEMNSHYFIIEKSDGFGMFKEIIRIPSTGNSNNYLKYSFKDIKPYEGPNYYKIFEVDLNGNKHEYSTIHVYYPYKIKADVFNILGQPSDLISTGFKIIRYENGNTNRKFILAD